MMVIGRKGSRMGNVGERCEREYGEQVEAAKSRVMSGQAKTGMRMASDK